MTYFHAHRGQDHSDGFTYSDPVTGKRKKLTPNERLLLITICLALPDKYLGEVSPCDGQRRDLTYEDLSRLSGIPVEGVKTARETLALAELIDSWQPRANAPYTYQLHNRLYCSSFECLDSRHYPRDWPGVVKTTPLGEQDSPPQGERFSGARGVLALEHKETKETKNSNNPESPSVISVEEISKPEPIDPETANNRIRSRRAIEEILKERGNPPITANLKEWAVILRANGNTGALERALEHTAQGYDLPDTGPWQQGRANIVELLLKTGRPN